MEENEEQGEDEGLKEIREHEDCNEEEINEENEAKADLFRKYDYDDLTGERQENFNN